MTKLDFELVIIGAGVAGINAAYRFQSEGPKDMTYAVLESRDSIGGTWDLFKYPGIRSDSDIFTFGFEWSPWKKPEMLAMGPEIKEYMQRCAAENGMDKHIRFRHKATAANWNSKIKRWELTVCADGDTENPIFYTTRFIYLGTGYYDYEQPLEAIIPGIDKFQGKVIHPQFWPSDYDYTRKEMVVIGSGATAITIVPSVAERVKHVTMLQRSPAYVVPLPNRSLLVVVLFKLFPRRMAHWINRWIWIIQVYALIQICGVAPGLVRRYVRLENEKHLPPAVRWNPHFNPRYNPWEQRMCVSKDGDLFAALRSGKASVVTDTIDSVTENSIKLTSGQELHPDVIVTATGLRLLFGGGIKFTLDGEELSVAGRFLWRAGMLQDIPNLFFTIGFENASWTLGCDCAAYIMVRVIKQISSANCAFAYPYMGKKQAESMPLYPHFTLKATYLNGVHEKMPKGGTGVWAPRGNYMKGLLEAKYGDIKTDLIME
ncbi:hypothetical protein QQS21_010417 [Conoideocrella luteorostrata]|uniref:Uncharacterized protein n=1 Tax=Conoideocrella luteorostrata TaxID=1105319 RepID=A0AAJ0CF25_9HYPO|nr:hypothetical protein QQS21_010417 [Conoideocrella luteorostrata]